MRDESKLEGGIGVLKRCFYVAVFQYHRVCDVVKVCLGKIFLRQKRFIHCVVQIFHISLQLLIRSMHFFVYVLCTNVMLLLYCCVMFFVILWAIFITFIL